MDKVNESLLCPIFVPIYILLLFNVASIATNLSPPILLNCGGMPSQEKDMFDRIWTGDVGSKFASASPNTSSLTADSQHPSVDSVPYMTARISTSKFSYIFPVGEGRLFIRLHFYPANYGGFNASDAWFSVTAGPYTLLQNFSALLTVKALEDHKLMREYSIYTTSGYLNLTFVPSPNVPNAYAFVNGIEVNSNPYTFPKNASFGSGQQEYSIDNDQAVETMVRLNVGGNDLPPTMDSGGLYRTWLDDSKYRPGGGTYTRDANVTINYTNIPSFVAPLDVYSSARIMGLDPSINRNIYLTWILTIDTGFFYLVRLHFCEIKYFMNKSNQRVFNIYINNQTVEALADVIGWSGGNGRPVYRDYVLQTNEKSSQELWVQLQPNTMSKPEYDDVILNGLEIFKLSDNRRILAGPNPTLPPEPPPNFPLPTGNSKIRRTPLIAGCAVGVMVVISIIYISFTFFQQRKNKRKNNTNKNGPSELVTPPAQTSEQSSGSGKTGTTNSTISLPSNLCRHFSFAEIKSATNDFDEALLLGVGGFGKVYKGEIDGGATKVAIKRGNPLSKQGVHEFLTEIEMLSKLRHCHLVSLIGFCEENCEMILVYDYMAHGTLREHLYQTTKPPLTWKQRLEICIGAAHGLHYLHRGAKQTIIHRDVKTTNILLDDKWVAKVSDFGMSKIGPSLDHTHVSTVIKGTIGYLDPEYYRRQQLTEKSDVYSFGVVLLEVLCTRPVVNPKLPEEQVNLVQWALQCQNKGVLEQIIDPHLKGNITPESLTKFTEIAAMCVANRGADRPSIDDILWNLKFLLQLHTSAQESGVVHNENNKGEFPLAHA